ncbi:Na+/H+ antiporter subunit E [Hydrocarboniclastica marina]|nr:Na+/H+ antiporter subunit E [Hydrocarboniclastica marina]
MTMTRRLLPRPRLSLFLFLIWLLLSNSVSASSVFFGALLGWLIPMLSHRFWPDHTHSAHPLLMARYLMVVLMDIAVANLNVARLILGSPKKLRPAFVTYPLELDNDFAITVLASTISLTPGTVSSQISDDRRYLLIHALDMDSEEELIRGIKRRYEKPLMEIFQ